MLGSTTKTGYLAAALVAAVAAGGCNETAPGEMGVVLFTPDECGRLDGCDFGDGIGVGGAIQVWIAGAEGVSTAGFDLWSEDPDILDVVAIPDQNNRPTWQLTGYAGGAARLWAMDGAGNDVDFIDVPVRALSALTLEPFAGDAVGPTSDADFDEIWTVNAGANTSFYVTPLIGAGQPTMGVYEYGVTLDDGLFQSLLASAQPEIGYLYFNVLPGEYAASFETDQGVFVDALIIAQ